MSSFTSLSVKVAKSKVLGVDMVADIIGEIEHLLDLIGDDEAAERRFDVGSRERKGGSKSQRYLKCQHRDRPCTLEAARAESNLI